MPPWTKPAVINLHHALFRTPGLCFAPMMFRCDPNMRSRDDYQAVCVKMNKPVLPALPLPLGIQLAPCRA
jgi:hypothetical protein